MARITVSELLAEVLKNDAHGFKKDDALSPANGIMPMDIAKLAILCEHAYHVVLRDEIIADWRTLGDVEAHVAHLIEAGEAEPLEREEEDRTAWFYE